MVMARVEINGFLIGILSRYFLIAMSFFNSNFYGLSTNSVTGERSDIDPISHLFIMASGVNGSRTARSD